MVAPLALTLCVLVSQAPPAPPVKAPPFAETAKLFFLAGDLAKAQDWARQGLKREPRACRPLLTALAEYAYLVGRADELDPSQARQLLDLDRAISPGTPGRLTQPVLERFVLRPLQLATQHAKSGHDDSAQAIARQVLTVAPANLEAQALATPRRDAGQAPQPIPTKK